MNSRVDADRQLEELLDQWEVPACPPGLAERVVRHHPGAITIPFPRRRRGVIVPLLLVACLLSAGAWATVGRDYWRAPVSLTRVKEDVGIKRESPPARKVAVQVFENGAHAEPERAVADDRPQSLDRPKSPRRVGLGPEAPGVSEDAPQEPRQIHLPRCECGTSAIVCACSD